jgi:hypothetical protein
VHRLFLPTLHTAIQSIMLIKRITVWESLKMMLLTVIQLGKMILKISALAKPSEIKRHVIQFGQVIPRIFA